MANEKQTDELYIDLLLLVRKATFLLRRLWLVVLVLSILGGGLMAFRAVRAYQPMYRSQAMFSVSVHYSGNTDLTGYSYYYDKSAAKLVSETFPYLLQAESTRALISQRLGTGYINGTISSSSVADTNLITLTVTSRDPQAAYDNGYDSENPVWKITPVCFDYEESDLPITAWEVAVYAHDGSICGYREVSGAG